MPTKLCWSTVTLLVLLTTGVLLAGQNPAPQTPPQGHEAMGAAADNTDAHLQMLTEKLNLTDAQRTKLKPILQDQSQQQQAVHDDTSLSPEQKTAKIKAIHASFRDQISAVLTPRTASQAQGDETPGRGEAPTITTHPRRRPGGRLFARGFRFLTGLEHFRCSVWQVR
jgi:Spy/CpxP family protein refolding chaperone